MNQNKFIILFVILIIITIGRYFWYLKNKTNNQIVSQTQQTKEVSTNNSINVFSSTTAMGVINDLQSKFSQQGYKINLNKPTGLWWLSEKGIVINTFTTNTLTLTTTKTPGEQYDPNLKQSVLVHKMNIKDIGIMDDYFNKNNFLLQTNQSTNENKSFSYGYTQAYYNVVKKIRCRLEAIPDLDDVYAYYDDMSYSDTILPLPLITTSTITISCADVNQYDDAYNEQSPFLFGLANEKSSNIQDYMISLWTKLRTDLPSDMPPSITVCKSDPSLTIVTLDSVPNSSMAIHGIAKAMKQTSEGWRDAGLSAYQMNRMGCYSN